MKHLKKLVLLTFIVLTGIACSSDDDSSGNTTAENQAKIIGTWKFAGSTTNGVADTDNWICDFEDTLVISATTIEQSYFNDPSGTNGSDCQQDGTFTINYSINDNTLTDDDNSFSVEIITLNSTTFTTKDVDGEDTYTETYTKQ